MTTIHPRLRSIWTDMHRRCYQDHRPDFKWYGGKGVKVDPIWNDKMVFQEWALASGYKDGLTLDRIDVNGDYGPLNCRWTTIKMQERNRRNNRHLTFGGLTMCVSEWAEKLGMSAACLNMRLSTHKWSVEDALTVPIGARRIK